MSKVSRFFIVSLVVFLAIYLGAVLGIRMALEAAPKFVPVEDSYVYYQADIGFSDGAAVLPNYQSQPSVDVRKLCNQDCGYED